MWFFSDANDVIEHNLKFVWSGISFSNSPVIIKHKVKALTSWHTQWWAQMKDSWGFFCIWMQEAGRWKRVLSQNNNKLNSRYHGILLNCIYNCFYFSKSHYWSENILCMSFPTPFLAWFLSFSSLIFFILSSLQTGGLNIGSQACQASALSLSSVPSSLFIFSFEIGSPQMVHIDLELAL